MIGLYNGSVQAGDQSGVLIDSANKLTLVLNSSLQEEKEATIAIRTIEAQHKTVGSTTLAFEGTNADKWAFSKDNIIWGEYGAPLVLDAEINNKNTLLYTKAKAVSGENAQTDTSVQIKVTATIGTV